MMYEDFKVEVIKEVKQVYGDNVGVSVEKVFNGK